MRANKAIARLTKEEETREEDIKRLSEVVILSGAKTPLSLIMVAREIPKVPAYKMR